MLPHPPAAEHARVAGDEARGLRHQALLILWPAFLMAGVLEALVFVVVDPGALHWFGADELRWSASAVYSVTFLIFWGVIGTSGAITKLLESASPGPFQ
jgi:hypothetical protein